MNILPYGNAPIDAEEFTVSWQRFHLRWAERNDRFDKVARIARGDWTVVAPDDEELISRSPNMVQVALEDTAESSNLLPTVRVMASAATPEAKEDASIMERLGTSYLDVSEFPLLSIKSFLDLYAYGLFTWVVTWDGVSGPKVEWRDPRTCFPEPDYSALGVANRVFFARDVYLTQLPVEWQMKVQEHCALEMLDYSSFTDPTLTLVEYYDADRIVVGLSYNAATIPGTSYFLRSEPNYISVILEDYQNPIGICPAILGQAPDLDPEPRGQFDQVINILLTHIQLMALVVDNADDMVYADVWVKDLIGPLNQGGKSYINLGPQGAVGRLAPASPSFSLFNELQQLMDAFHVGARWPKTRPGDISQAIASGKFVESTVGMMNTVIHTGHTVMQRALQQALRVAFKADKLCGPKRTVSGVMRNQQFLMERDVDDIDLEALVRVDYGLGFGKTSSETAVLSIQYHQAGFVSTETVQENLEGIVDVGLERQRILLQQFRDMALAKMLQGLQEKSIPDKALVEMSRAVQDGGDVFEVFEKYVVEPQEEMLAQQLPSGLTGGMVSPGPQEQLALGPGAPTAPPPEELLAGLLGGGGGEQPETIGRLSTPLPGGGFAGSQATT